MVEEEPVRFDPADWSKLQENAQGLGPRPALIAFRFVSDLCDAEVSFGISSFRSTIGFTATGG
jgi:hypothetical protein